MPARDEIMLQYLDRLAYPPYPVQEEAILAWADCEQGVLLSAPTGTGKTLVAEACVYEGLVTGKQVYYSTPLIALTDQKLDELQATVTRWGFSADQVGLVTGHRTVNPDAPIKVVVAEVLLNRLLHQEAFDFTDVGSVVMDEFHNFNEPQRGIVWELSLSLLPLHVRVMLLSATVGAAHEFVNWMARSLDRRVTLVEGRERKVPLHFHWVGDELLPDYLEQIARGTEDLRRTPALVFCFDREICWATAEVLKGKDLFGEGQRKALLDRLEDFDFSVGGGSKLRTVLARGIGIHHAGLLPRYRRVVETLFQEKLLPFCVCTETLAAGLNLPARSVVLTTLVKGPRDKKKLIDPGVAQQIFGRAGRPAVRHAGARLRHGPRGRRQTGPLEGKVRFDPRRHARSRPDEGEKSAGEKETDPPRQLRLLERRAVHQAADRAPAKLASRGNLTWRWLGFLLEADTAVEPIRDVIRKRLMPQPLVDAELKRLNKMLVTLSYMGIVVLDPPPPPSWDALVKPGGGGATDVEATDLKEPEDESDEEADEAPADVSSLAGRLNMGGAKPVAAEKADATKPGRPSPSRTTPSPRRRRRNSKT